MISDNPIFRQPDLSTVDAALNISSQHPAPSKRHHDMMTPSRIRPAT
jgi:hypothetical protein